MNKISISEDRSSLSWKLVIIVAFQIKFWNKKRPLTKLTILTNFCFRFVTNLFFDRKICPKSQAWADILAESFLQTFVNFEILINWHLLTLNDPKLLLRFVLKAVVNFIKHSVIVIYDSWITMTRNFPILQL